MRALALIWLSSLVLGCAGHAADSDATEPDPKGWTISVDMSRTERFVRPETSPRWPVAGRAEATERVESIEVAGTPQAIAADGAFSTEVAVSQGLTSVPVLVRDSAGHQRKADRTLLAARFLPDTDHNPSAASIVLDNAILESMSGGIAAQAANVDIAGEILARDYLSNDSQCATWPVSAHQGAVSVKLVQSSGDLWLHIQVPNLYVYFEGECQGLLRTIPLAGEMRGTLDVWSRLAPKAGAGPCLDSFTHTTAQVQVLGWGFEVWGTGGPLQNWMIAAFSGDKATEARNQLTAQVQTRADAMLTEKLASISVFDLASELSLLERPIAMHLCLAGLDKIGTALVARIGARAHGNGMRGAPGAPQIEGASPVPAAKELVLDADLVGQLLFASWRDGGLTRAVGDADISVLQILVPQLVDRFPDSSLAQVTIDAELPPLVRATPQGPGDVSVELGDLMVDLTVEGKRIFRFGVTLTLQLDLVPVGGKLVPKVIDTSAKAALLDELYDGPDAALEAAVQVQIGNTAAALLGPSAAIALPALPGLGAPINVTADPGGRFLHVTLSP